MSIALSTDLIRAITEAETVRMAVLRRSHDHYRRVYSDIGGSHMTPSTVL